MDVADWLHSLGLKQYEAAFRANDVDAAVVPNLAADDLKDLGIISVGHRRQLLEAMAALRLKPPTAYGPRSGQPRARHRRTQPAKRPIADSTD